MQTYFLITIILCTIVLIETKLIKVIQINRHGARTASNFNEILLNNFFGEDKKLTQNGYRQHQILGKQARKRYIIEKSFISEEYDPKEFEIYTTPTQRTVYSADGFLSGLYPGYIVKSIFNEPTLQLRSDDTIPIKEAPQIKEILLTVFSKKEHELFDIMDCELNGQNLKELSKNKEQYPDIMPITEGEMKTSAEALAQYYHKEKELEDSNPEKFMTQINKVVITDFYHYGKKYEKEFGKEVHNTLKKISINKWYNTRLKETVLANIDVSRFMLKLIELFQEAIKNQTPFKKYTVYSAHDSALVNTFTNLLDLSFLNKIVSSALSRSEAFDFLIPLYTSNIIFELHLDESTKEYSVKVLYNGIAISYPLREGTQSNASGHILYKLFERLLQKRVHPDWEKVDCSKATLYHTEIFPAPSSNDYFIENGNYYPNY